MRRGDCTSGEVDPSSQVDYLLEGAELGLLVVDEQSQALEERDCSVHRCRGLLCRVCHDEPVIHVGKHQEAPAKEVGQDRRRCSGEDPPGGGQPDR